jgi:hypothetical protein
MFDISLDVILVIILVVILVVAVVVVVLDIRLDSVDDRNINDVDKLSAVTIDIIKYINFEPNHSISISSSVNINSSNY